MSPLIPLLQRGALIGLDLPNPIPDVVLFQYNPATLTRTLQPRNPRGGEDVRSEAHRLSGPPVETIRVEIELDATEEMGDGDIVASVWGIHPRLAMLELLMYPSVALTLVNEGLAALGLIEIASPQEPLTLFVWGVNRVLPVRLTEMTVTEEQFDTLLNPIQAKVTLGMRVLSYKDLQPADPGYWVYLANNIAKDAMAVIGTADEVVRVAQGKV